MDRCIGPLKNNIHRIESAIVNKPTISEMKIKIYCPARSALAQPRNAAPKNVSSLL